MKAAGAKLREERRVKSGGGNDGHLRATAAQDTHLRDFFFLFLLRQRKKTPPGWPTTEEDGRFVTWPRLNTKSRCGAEVAHGLHPLSDCWSSDYYARRRQLKVTKLGIYLPPCVCVVWVFVFVRLTGRRSDEHCWRWLMKVRAERGHPVFGEPVRGDGGAADGCIPQQVHPGRNMTSDSWHS